MRSNPHRSAGFTLVELVVSMSILTILVGGMASAVLVASHALPDENDLSERKAAAAEAVERISHDLALATAFVAAEPDTVEFTVLFALEPSRLRLIRRRGTRRLCSRHSRCTRSRPARNPSSFSIAWILRYPYRGCLLASSSIAPTSGRSVSGLPARYRCVDRGCPTALHARRSESSSVRTARSTPSRTAAGLSLFPSRPPR